MHECSANKCGVGIWKDLPVLRLFRFQKNMKIFLQPVGKYYLVGSLLINCHTCLHGSLTYKQV